MRRLLGLALIVAAGAGACTTIREELPTQPEPSDPDTVANGPLIPAAPTSTPTPDPVQSEPLPEPPGSDDGGGDGGSAAYCGDPAPPPISQVNLRVHARQTTRSILDSSPVVGPDAGYCQEIGYTDGRSYCPVRPPGHPERAACEAEMVGSATDTGRPGPTWSADGRGCGRAAGGAYCLNHPDNQYLVYAYGSGTFRACVANGACGKIQLP